MSGGGGEGDQVKLEFTPTWIVAIICFGVVLISLLIERLFHCVGMVKNACALSISLSFMIFF